MVRIAGERIADLFAMAEREAIGSRGPLADRYVKLARKIGMRYNVRLLREYRELYCRSCSVFWVEGRTVRTRLRAGHRVRTCLACGRERRTRNRPIAPGRPVPPDAPSDPAVREEGSLVEIAPEPSELDVGDEEGEEE